MALTLFNGNRHDNYTFATISAHLRDLHEADGK